MTEKKEKKISQPNPKSRLHDYCRNLFKNGMETYLPPSSEGERGTVNNEGGGKLYRVFDYENERSIVFKNKQFGAALKSIPNARLYSLSRLDKDNEGNLIPNQRNPNTFRRSNYGLLLYFPDYVDDAGDTHTPTQESVQAARNAIIDQTPKDTTGPNQGQPMIFPRIDLASEVFKAGVKEVGVIEEFSDRHQDWSGEWVEEPKFELWRCIIMAVTSGPPGTENKQWWTNQSKTNRSQSPDSPVETLNNADILDLGL